MVKASLFHRIEQELLPERQQEKSTGMPPFRRYPLWMTLASTRSFGCVWGITSGLTEVLPTQRDFFPSCPATQAGTGLATRDEGPQRERKLPGGERWSTF